MYAIHELLHDEIHEEFSSISEQFKSMYEKCYNLARVIIQATTLSSFYNLC